MYFEAWFSESRDRFFIALLVDPFNWPTNTWVQPNSALAERNNDDEYLDFFREREETQVNKVIMDLKDIRWAG